MGRRLYFKAKEAVFLKITRHGDISDYGVRDGKEKIRGHPGLQGMECGLRSIEMG